MLQTNLQNLEDRLDQSGISQFLVTSLSDIYYLSGFTGSAATIFISKGSNPVFVTDTRYTSQSNEEVTSSPSGSDFDIQIADNADVRILEIIAQQPATTLYIQSSTPLSRYTTYSKDINIKVESENYLSILRSRKSELEITQLEDQFHLAAKSLQTAIKSWKYGQTESEWAAELEYQMKRSGSRYPSFESIVASGIRSSLPHGQASNKVILEGEPITIDFGSKLNYCSDITRQVYNGNDSQVLKIINTVHTAMKASIDAAKPGMKCSALDAVARDYISSEGFGNYFTHSLGHGVGIDVHEQPRLSQGSTDTLEEGMVVTIEPGIYIPGQYGARLEDTILITKNGARSLTPLDTYIYKI